MKMTHDKLYKVVLAGMFAAMAYVLFTYFKFTIPLSGGDAISIHLGNAVCVLAALLLGGVYGGISGAVGLTIGDLFDPVYFAHAPKTFLIKLCIGLAAGLIAHRIGKINQSNDNRHIVKWVVIATIGALLFNAVFAPLTGYYYNILFLGKSAAELTVVWNVTVTAFNAVTSAIVTIAVYMPLRTALKRAGIFEKIK